MGNSLSAGEDATNRNAAERLLIGTPIVSRISLSSSSRGTPARRILSVGRTQTTQRTPNLSVVLRQPSRYIDRGPSTSHAYSQDWNSLKVDEADSASGPSPHLGRSAPNHKTPNMLLPPPSHTLLRYNSIAFGTDPCASLNAPAVGGAFGEKVRRCMSSKELGTLAPPSGSPYAYMLHKKEELEVSMRQRLVSLRESAPDTIKGQGSTWVDTVNEIEGSSTTSSSRTGLRETTNEMRNRRRAQHAQAVVDDLCRVVAELFVAEAKLLDPRNYGVPTDTSRESNAYKNIDTKSLERTQITKTIHDFVSSLPLRYALGADTPSEVLLHMRLMAAARSDKTKAALHIHNLEDDSNWSLTVAASNSRNNHSLRLVTLSCHDTAGLLEYITKLLATSGSRVLDADVMLNTEGIALDRFVVEMTGRLRLDKLANLIEAFLRKAADKRVQGSEASVGTSSSDSKSSATATPPAMVQGSGSLYFQAPVCSGSGSSSEEAQQNEADSGVPLSEVLASSSQANLSEPKLPRLRKLNSLPTSMGSHCVSPLLPTVRLHMRCTPEFDSGLSSHLEGEPPLSTSQAPPPPPTSQPLPSPPPLQARNTRARRPLVDRPAMSDLDRTDKDSSDDDTSLDFVTVSGLDSAVGNRFESRNVPLIPFDELMLIETIGTGRVSTIYRSAWQHGSNGGQAPIHMVALKVAMMNTMTNDSSHVDELRREADIAARLQHPNICDLVGVAADRECFCLAYDYCEGGSVLSLLSDSSRYYEYLPIALDVANGMAYLHSRNIIHRDLKPSNVLLTRDHRAKIADFGMSINNHGQELTAETGTYRYMAPEVIRHESYSSNADVYSFGICLWQLITREVPFATMTPVQAAYAVAEGRRPDIPLSTPRRLQEIIVACWDQDSHRRPSFTYIAMALADYAKMAFSPANVGAQTLQIANEMLATVEGNSTVNVDFTTPVAAQPTSFVNFDYGHQDSNNDVGLEIE